MNFLCRRFIIVILLMFLFLPQAAMAYVYGYNTITISDFYYGFADSPPNFTEVGRSVGTQVSIDYLDAIPPYTLNDSDSSVSWSETYAQASADNATASSHALFNENVMEIDLEIDQITTNPSQGYDIIGSGYFNAGFIANEAGQVYGNFVLDHHYWEVIPTNEAGWGGAYVRIVVGNNTTGETVSRVWECDYDYDPKEGWAGGTSDMPTSNWPIGALPNDLLLNFNAGDDGYVEGYVSIWLGSEPNAVPVPSALWLLGSGLAGILGLSRWKNIFCLSPDR